MKTLLILTYILTAFFFQKETSTREPFVVLEFKENTNLNDKISVDRNNNFLKDQSYNTTHKVKEGESLSGILNKYYKNTGLNMRVLELAIIEINKHAFVRNNPNFLFAGKKIKIPSINEIMNLVKQTPTNANTINNSRKNHIYFYGN
tara:strand:- start:1546 stop:1986 length:441 start_codon:yes stop_codon:yes gene_type:complete